MEKEGLLLDNVESSWRGILDMTVNDVDKTLYGLTSTPVYFGLWAAPLEEIRFEDTTGKIHYEVKKGLVVKKPMVCNNFSEKQKNINANYMQISEAQKILQQKNIDIDLNNILGNYLENKNANSLDEEAFKTPKKETSSKDNSPNKKIEEKYIENINNVIKNNIMNPPKLFQKKKYEQDQTKNPLDYPIRNDEPIKKVNEKIMDSNNFNEESKAKNFHEDIDISPKNVYNMPTNISEEENLKRKKQIETNNQDNNKNNMNVEEKKENNKDFENSIIAAQNSTISNDLHFASFIIDKDNNEKYQQFDMINEVLKEHSKFVSVLNTRSNYIKPIVHYLNAGNIKSALFLLSKLNLSIKYIVIQNKLD